MVVTPALRSVFAWSAITGSEGEDDLEAFPLPGESEPGPDAAVEADEAEVAVQEAAPEVADPEVAVVADAAAASVEGALAPTVPTVLPAPVDAALVPVGAGGGAGSGGAGGGGGGGGGGAGSDGSGRRRQRISIFDMVDQPMTIFEHLDELRKRIVWAVVAFVAGTATTFAFVRQILAFTERVLPAYHAQLQFTAPMEALFATIRIAALGGVALASPVILYQIIAYILPALTRKERILLFRYLPATVLLFIGGMCFGYFVFQPIALRVALDFLPGILARPTLTNWVNFLMDYSVPFGLLFELPVVVLVLVKIGILSPDTLIKGRRVAIFGSVVVAAMFAPPGDFIFTPSLIALPIIALYEVSIQAARIAYRQRQREMSQL